MQLQLLEVRFAEQLVQVAKRAILLAKLPYPPNVVVAQKSQLQLVLCKTKRRSNSEYAEGRTSWAKTLNPRPSSLALTPTKHSKLPEFREILLCPLLVHPAKLVVGEKEVFVLPTLYVGRLSQQQISLAWYAQTEPRLRSKAEIVETGKVGPIRGPIAL